MLLTGESMKGWSINTCSMRIAEHTAPPHAPRGTWRDQEFKAYNFDALGLPPNGGALHPLLKVGCALSSALHR